MENEETTKTATLRADDSWKPEYNVSTIKFCPIPILLTSL